MISKSDRLTGIIEIDMWEQGIEKVRLFTAQKGAIKDGPLLNQLKQSIEVAHAGMHAHQHRVLHYESFRLESGVLELTGSRFAYQPMCECGPPDPCDPWDPDCEIP